jgi:hypothetical protein
MLHLYLCRCHVFVALIWHTGCDIKRAPKGIQVPENGMRSPGRLPFERTFFQSNGEAMNAHTKVSSNVVARADVLSERVIFWGLVSTAVVISIAMLKGMLGYAF